MGLLFRQMTINPILDILWKIGGRVWIIVVIVGCVGIEWDILEHSIPTADRARRAVRGGVHGETIAPRLPGPQ